MFAACSDLVTLQSPGESCFSEGLAVCAVRIQLCSGRSVIDADQNIDHAAIKPMFPAHRLCAFVVISILDWTRFSSRESRIPRL
jgi:hypothetical protein